MSAVGDPIDIDVSQVIFQKEHTGGYRVKIYTSTYLPLLEWLRGNIDVFTIRNSTSLGLLIPRIYHERMNFLMVVGFIGENNLLKFMLSFGDVMRESEF